MKNVIKLILLNTIILVILTGCSGMKKEEDNVENNLNMEDKIQDELTFTNTSIISTNNNSTLVTTVTNKSTSDKKINVFNIIIKDKEGNEITRLKGYVGETILAGESKEITSNIDMNLDSTYDIEYHLVK